MKKRNGFVLEFSVFLAGAVGMILELVGIRMLAPYYGTSLNTWSVMIGIVLGSLSLGYWYGGLLAKRHASYEGLSMIALISGIDFLSIVLFKDLVIYVIGQLPYVNLVWESLVTTFTLFFLPNFLLGMISPYVIQLKLKSLSATGKHVGLLYAIATVGSIGGTFAAGFLLIPLLGTSKIVFLLSIILLISSLMLAPSKYTLLKSVTLAISLLLFICFSRYESYARGKGLIEKDSANGKILVFKTAHPITHEPTTYLITGAYGYQSAKSGRGISPYIPISDTVIHALGNVNKRMLVIGGGAFSLPDYFLFRYPNITMDVVEIDHEIVELASSYFGHKKNVRLNTYIVDGRIYINKTTSKYDVIYNDAYTDLYPPFTLNTQEALQNIYARLNENGLYLANVISPLEGKDSALFQSVFKTYASVFPEVLALPMQSGIKKDIVQNTLIIGIKGKNKLHDQEFRDIYSRRWKGVVRYGTPILTDDFAPIEGYLLSITAQKPLYPLSRYYLKSSLNASGEYIRSLLGFF